MIGRKGRGGWHDGGKIGVSKNEKKINVRTKDRWRLEYKEDSLSKRLRDHSDGSNRTVIIVIIIIMDVKFGTTLWATCDDGMGLFSSFSMFTVIFFFFYRQLACSEFWM